MVNHRALTAAMIDSREFLAARRRADTQAPAPAGTRIAFTGGTDCNDHHAHLGRARQGPRQAPRHGAAAWRQPARRRAHRRLLGRQPQGRRRSSSSPTGHGTATRHPSSATTSMLEALPIGVVVFPGSGISANLADKASKLGIPVWRFRRGRRVSAASLSFSLSGTPMSVRRRRFAGPRSMRRSRTHNGRSLRSTATCCCHDAPMALAVQPGLSSDVINRAGWIKHGNFV